MNIGYMFVPAGGIPSREIPGTESNLYRVTSIHACPHGAQMILVCDEVGCESEELVMIDLARSVEVLQRAALRGVTELVRLVERRTGHEFVQVCTLFHGFSFHRRDLHHYLRSRMRQWEFMQNTMSN